MSFNISRRYLIKAIKTGKSAEDMQTEIGCAKSTIYNNLRKHGLQLPSRDLEPGEPFGNLTVLRKLGTNGKETFYECECVCGTIKSFRRCNLVGGYSNSCGCTRHRSGADHHSFTGFGEISGKHWSNVLAHAKRKGHTVSITIEEAWELFLEQGRRCNLSGLPIQFDGRKRTTASLDRIDSELGYVPGNVQWVHKDINRMKNHFDQEYFVNICRRITRYQRSA
jgi:hypothetical protein